MKVLVATVLFILLITTQASAKNNCDTGYNQCQVFVFMSHTVSGDPKFGIKDEIHLCFNGSTDSNTPPKEGEYCYFSSIEHSGEGHWEINRNEQVEFDGRLSFWNPASLNENEMIFEYTNNEDQTVESTLVPKKDLGCSFYPLC